MVGRSRVVVTAESQAQLQALAGSHERGEADRARAILLTLTGWSSERIGEAFGVREDTVRLWRMRFMQGGAAGLQTHSPPGASPVKAETALAVAEEVLSAPVADRTDWTLRRLAAEIEQRAGLRSSRSRLSVVLRKKGVALIEFRGDSGTSHDQSRNEGTKKSFAPAAGVVHELEEAEIQRQLLLRDAPVWPQPGA